VTAVLVLQAQLASMLYHLCETQKHRMLGYGTPLDTKEWNFILINLDRAAASLLSIRLIFVVGGLEKLLQLYLPSILILMMVLILSEVPLRHERRAYMLLHTIWHVGAAILVDSMCQTK
jgi:hypothetical protein